MAVATPLAATVDPAAAMGGDGRPAGILLQAPWRPRPPPPVATARTRDIECIRASPFFRVWRGQKAGKAAWPPPSLSPSPSSTPPPPPISMEPPAAADAADGRKSANSITDDAPAERVDMGLKGGGGCCTGSDGCLANWTAAVQAMGGDADGALDAGMPPVF